MSIVLMTTEEDTSPRGGSSLLLMAPAEEEEWIWVEIKKTIMEKSMEDNQEKTIEIKEIKEIKEIQRKDIKIIEEDFELKVTKLVELVTTTHLGEKYIGYVLEEHLAAHLAVDKYDNDKTIKTSEEDESARKDTIEIEIRSGPTLFIKRINRKDLDAEIANKEKYGGTSVTVTVRDTKEERRRKIKQILKTKNFDLRQKFFFEEVLV